MELDRGWSASTQSFYRSGAMKKRHLLLPISLLAIGALVAVWYIAGVNKRSNAEKLLVGAWDGQCIMASSSNQTRTAKAMGKFSHVEFGKDGTVQLDRNFSAHYSTESGSS